jgi:hypothetical protein
LHTADRVYDAVMKTALIVLLAAGCGASVAEQRRDSIEQWAGNHPEASRELGVWVQTHPEAAALFFEWDGHHPERSHEFVTWTIQHPAQPIETFVVMHPGWQYFDRIMEQHRPAAEAFMAWCRRHPPAAERLMSHPGGLIWAGRHLYADSWHMEHPGQ